MQIAFFLDVIPIKIVEIEGSQYGGVEAEEEEDEELVEEDSDEGIYALE